MRWLIAALAGLLVAEAVLFVQVIARSDIGLGADFLFYAERGSTWIATGEWYHPFQFEPHEFTTMLDNVYPPTAIPLFVFGAVAPLVLWWAVPIALTAYALWRLRPSPVAWVVILLLLMWPRSIGGYLYGNTTMWTTAGLAAGLVWGFPVILLAIKTTVWPWGLLTLRHRGSWIAVAVVGVFSVFAWELWLDYLTVMRNQASVSIWAILGDIPPMLIPVVAWLGRSAPARNPEVVVGVAGVVAREPDGLEPGRRLVDDIGPHVVNR